MPSGLDKLRLHELEMQDTLLRQMLHLEPGENLANAVAQLQTIIVGLDANMAKRDAENKRLRARLHKREAGRQPQASL